MALNVQRLVYSRGHNASCWLMGIVIETIIILL